MSDDEKQDRKLDRRSLLIGFRCARDAD